MKKYARTDENGNPPQKPQRAQPDRQPTRAIPVADFGELHSQPAWPDTPGSKPDSCPGSLVAVSLDSSVTMPIGEDHCATLKKP
jgi:hypothetical protein